MSSKELEVYDESCYPGAEEDELELSSNDQTCLALDDKLPPSDVTCSICSDILIDPVSLHCGHTYCQLCLARVWRSRGKLPPNSLTCPVCRLPWRNYPGVNITLRSIIEKGYSDLVAHRKSEDPTPEDEALLKEFHTAKDNSWKQERSEGQTQLQRQRDARAIVTLFVLVLLLMFAVIVLLVVGGSFWVQSGASGEYMRKPVTQWSSADVVAWVEGLGQWTKANVTQVFINEAITGSQLLRLDKSALSSFGIVNEFRQHTILDAIEELRINEFNQPRNLFEFMAAHRKQTFALAILYKMWPRLSFLYIYIFAYDEIFLPILEDQVTVGEKTQQMLDPSLPDFEPSWTQLLFFVGEVILVPHFIVLRLSWVWWAFHPWICSAIIIHCFLHMSKDGSLALQYAFSSQTWKYSFVRSQLYQVVVHALAMMVIVVIIYALWPLIPHFICDIIFYVAVWHSAFVAVLAPLKKFCNFRVNFQHNIRVG